MPPSPTTADDSNHFQDLFKRVDDELKIPLKEVLEAQHVLLDILQTSSPSKIALPISGVLMEPPKQYGKLHPPYHLPARGLTKSTTSPQRELNFYSPIQHPTTGCGGSQPERETTAQLIRAVRGQTYLATKYILPPLANLGGKLCGTTRQV